MNLVRPPRGPLRPFVKLIWWADDSDRGERFARERVVPTGAMHVVVRLSGPPLRLFDGVDTEGGREVSRCVIGGARASYYVKDVGMPSRSVGALLLPGAAWPLFGLPAEELAGRHTRLEDVWGTEAGSLRDRLLEAATPDDQLILFESALAARLPRVRGIHPAVAHALQRFEETSAVGTVVEETGFSHRRLITLFREATGLAPKSYCRVRRFQRVLDLFAAGRTGPGWAEVAAETGYADQAHLTREFSALAGVTPGQFLALAPRHAHHVPVTACDSNPFKTRPAAGPTFST